ncbi:MAG: hypothetical protein ACI97A_002588 [Planctomycetota bacterium]|jgi:hypothetical protein
MNQVKLISNRCELSDNKFLRRDNHDCAISAERLQLRGDGEDLFHHSETTLPLIPLEFMSQKERTTLGWREWVGLPELGVAAIKAKVDTGARTSTLHAYHIEEFSRRGVTWLRFELHPEQRKSQPVVNATARLLEYRSVRSSSGKAERRPVIETKLQIHGIEFIVELTLTERDAMGFRMLLGRQAIRGRFVVDPGTSFTNGDRRSHNCPTKESNRKKR